MEPNPGGQSNPRAVTTKKEGINGKRQANVSRWQEGKGTRRPIKALNCQQIELRCERGEILATPWAKGRMRLSEDAAKCRHKSTQVGKVICKRPFVWLSQLAIAKGLRQSFFLWMPERLNEIFLSYNRSESVPLSIQYSIRYHLSICPRPLITTPDIPALLTKNNDTRCAKQNFSGPLGRLVTYCLGILASITKIRRDHYWIIYQNLPQ